MPVTKSQSTSSTMEDQSKPVTCYPKGCLPGQPKDHPAGYPPAQPSYPTTTVPAYHYVAPPPAAYYNPNPNPNHGLANNTQCNIFLKYLYSVVAVVFAFTGVFLLIFFLHDRLPDFRVDSVTVTSFNVSTSQVTANWDIDFFVRNPSRKSIFYDHIVASVYYHKEFLSATSLVPFYQEEKDQRRIQASFADLSFVVDEGIGEEIKNSRAVKFDVQIMAWVAFNSEDLGTGGTLLKVLCEDVKVGFSSNMVTGTLLGGSSECDVSEPENASSSFD